MEEARPKQSWGDRGNKKALRGGRGRCQGPRPPGLPSARRAGEGRAARGWVAAGKETARPRSSVKPSGAEASAFGRPAQNAGRWGREAGRPGPYLLRSAARPGGSGWRTRTRRWPGGRGAPSGRTWLRSEAALVRGAARPSGCPSAGGGAGAGSTPPKIVRPQGGPQRQPPPVSPPPRALSCRGTGADGGARLRVGGEGTLVRGPGEPWRGPPSLAHTALLLGRRHPAPCSESSLFSVLRPLEGGRCREPSSSPSLVCGEGSFCPESCRGPHQSPGPP